MKLTYLGTAAAEGWPAVFCSCACCQKARQLGGKDIRTRSQALVDDRLLLDLPPDTYLHYLTHRFDLPGIRHLLVTHSHSDHFYAKELGMRCPPFCDEGAGVLNIYGNPTVQEEYRRQLEAEPAIRRFTRFHCVQPFVPFEAGGYTVTPLRALHDRSELCLIYLISDGEKTLLYGHDTGVFPQDTWDYLKHHQLDLASLDCTTQSHPDGGNHMGLIDAAGVKQRLLDEGIAHEKTVFVVNHFSHNGLWDHQTVTARAAEQGMLASYDGMSVSI